MASAQLIGLLGGTFDPIHNGHLHLVKAAAKRIGFDQLRIIPCRQPPHRDAPIASASQRLEMLQLAITETPEFVVEICELESDEPSYAFETLSILRGKNAQARFCWIMGLDAFQNFTQWFRWRQILELTHLLIVQRPGYQVEQNQDSQELLERYQITDIEVLRQTPAGGILVLELDALDVSATYIRQRLRAGKNVAGLMPQTVIDWLEQNPIYS